MTGGAAALVARDVTLTLAGKRVLDGVSLEVHRGEFICLCGPNGGGKTTFLKVVLGLVRPDSGSIEVLGSAPENSRGSAAKTSSTSRYAGCPVARPSGSSWPGLS